MNGEERRKKIVERLRTADSPLSGGRLAKELHVSRQVIVQDVALLRAAGQDIIPTARGYVLEKDREASRVFKVIHTDDQVRDELQTIVDLGGTVADVFIYHKVYGVIRGQLGLGSRSEIDRYMDKIEGGASHLLKNTTSGYHYHTVTARSEAVLDAIEAALRKKGYLAPLQAYEPMDLNRGNTRGQEERKA